MTEKVEYSLLKTAGETNIACLRLNKPKALNALDLDMVQAIQEYLDAWRSDDSIGAIFIDGEGEKAFCAGGDIVSMYQAMVKEKATSPGKLPDFMAQFFEQEYRLDYTIHAYEKPIICWGSGIIMGGGLGVFAGASHKIVTETVRVAMPEITIGLFPDVGASYFLNKMPKGVGKFLGLTASSINAADCLNISLASYFLLDESKTLLLSSLSDLTELSSENISVVINKTNSDTNANATLQTLVGNLSLIMPILNELAPMKNISEIDEFLHALSQSHPQNKMLNRALSSFRNGSPITARLVVEQLQRGQSLSLAECFQMELNIAYRCSVTGEFQEGVRALLIDKDNKPKWLYQNDSQIPQELIEAHFSGFFENNMSVNPLASLTTEYGTPHE